MSIEKETGLTPEEAGAMIGCSAYTVKDLCRRNAIPFYRVGTRYMFTRSSLQDWINEQLQNNYKKGGSMSNGKH